MRLDNNASYKTSQAIIERNEARLVAMGSKKGKLSDLEGKLKGLAR